MRANATTVAALAVGGVLVAGLLARRRHAIAFHPDDAVFEPDRDTRIALGAALAASAGAVVAGLLLSQRPRRGAATQSNVVEWVELEVPVRTAYNQWTQFEEFPRFMSTVESVEQIDDTHLRWRAVVAGKTKEWTAEITEQIPDERIAWRSTGGVANSGVVTFHKIADDRCRVMLQMDYEPEGAMEKVGDAAGAVKLTTKGNLKKFKELVESRGQETGAWRGTVQQQH